FQQRNTNSSIGESLKRVGEIQNICTKTHKHLVVYISMGFGNPYGDPYSEQIVFDWVNKIVDCGVKTVSLADTVGVANPEQVHSITKYVVGMLPGIHVGVHLHSRPSGWKKKLAAAVDAGCRRFDGALKGIGGCPMANDELVGNMNTEWMLEYFQDNHFLTGIDEQALSESLRLASEIFV
ncbi:MAG TPA: hydroxymethylglutaryl-CoA lyase, partial [Chitinophagaceae bacterium]|nr:hydroxymethylglutaryl-CoA lyase [Chitinophagaceae bacterium]